MVVAVALLAALGGHTGVAHDSDGIIWHKEVHLPSGQRALVDMEFSAAVVGVTGSVGAPRFTLYSQDGKPFGLLLAG